MTGAGIDKTELYGEFLIGELDKRKQAAWRDRLHRKAAHKSLDIADQGEEMGDIHANRTYNGIGLKEILAIGGMAMGGIGLWQAPAIVSAIMGSGEVSQVTPIDTDMATDISLGGGVPVDVKQIGEITVE